MMPDDWADVIFDVTGMILSREQAKAISDLIEARVKDVEAERDRLRGALWKIAARVDRLTGGLTYTEKATRDIARAALGEAHP